MSSRGNLTDFGDLAGLVTTATARPMRDIVSPLDGEVLGAVPICEPEDIAFAADRARAAARRWAEVPVEERCAIANRFRSLLLQRAPQTLDLVHAENGKSRINAFEELMDTALNAGYYAQHAPGLLAPRLRQGAIPLLTHTVERYRPVGIVGVIAPWNYPLTLAISDAIPALLAGNAVILKPDSLTPFTALAAVRLLREAGLPQDLMQVVTGSGSVLGGPLIQEINFLMFTGSSQTGRVVARECADRLIACSAELGGKNPLIVLADADIDRAAAGAVQACFSTTGQLCVSIERIYAHRSVFDEFCEKFAARTRALRLGTSAGWDIDLGPMVSLDHFEKVKGQVDEAVADGATVLAGGRARPDLGPTFYEPTVLTGVHTGTELFDSETFGPVVSVYSFDDDAEAVRLANDTDYGLNASVWSQNLAHARFVAEQIAAGTVNINEGYAAAWGSHGAPIGGVGHSGLGRRHGREGIIKYTEPQTISIQHLALIGPLPGMSRELYFQIMRAAGNVLRRVPLFGSIAAEAHRSSRHSAATASSRHSAASESSRHSAATASFRHSAASESSRHSAASESSRHSAARRERRIHNLLKAH